MTADARPSRRMQTMPQACPARSSYACVEQGCAELRCPTKACAVLQADHALPWVAEGASVRLPPRKPAGRIGTVAPTGLGPL